MCERSNILNIFEIKKKKVFQCAQCVKEMDIFIPQNPIIKRQPFTIYPKHL